MRLVSLVTRYVIPLGVALVATFTGSITQATSVDSAAPSKDLAISLDLTESGLVTVTENHTWLVSPSATPTVVRHLPLYAPHTGELMKKFEYTNFNVSAGQDGYELKVLDNGSELEVLMTKSADTSEDSAEPFAADQELKEVAVALSYNVNGVLSSSRLTNGEIASNDFFWSILADSKVNYSNVAFTINAPTSPRESQCLVTAPPVDQEESVSAPLCAEQTAGNPLTYLASPVPAGTEIGAMVSYPAGTFDRTAPLTVDWSDAQHPENSEGTDAQLPFDPTWTENIDQGLAQTNSSIIPIIIGFTVATLTAGFIFLTRRRSDFRFVASAPGQIPADTVAHPVEKAPTTVGSIRSDTPPSTLTVAEAGAVLSAGLRGKEVTATLIDLAVRGVLSIAELPTETGSISWRFTKHAANSELILHPHELALMEALFAHGDEVETVSIHANFALGALDVLRTLGQEIANQELFKQLLEHESIGHEQRKQRTALGRAYLEQLTGFREFLSAPTQTELDSLVAKSSITEVFSAYLPWALIFDRSDHWAQACDAYSGSPQQGKTSEVRWFVVPDRSAPTNFSDLLKRISQLLKTGY